MRTEQVSIGSIRPDPKQPRKIFDEKHIKGLARSLEVEGIINPVEVDTNGMIITGECRWRAAKLAGWKKVPIIVNDTELSKYERLRRQMAENLHQSAAGGASPMNAIDVANGYKRMIKMKTGKDYTAGLLSRGEVYGLMKGIPEELGIHATTMYSYLRLLDEPEHVLEDVKKGKPRTYYEAISYAPEKYRDRLKEAVSEGKITRRSDLQRFARLAKTKPERAEIEFLRITQQQSDDANRVLNRAVELSLALKAANFKKFSPQDREMVLFQLNSLLGTLRNYVGVLKEKLPN